MNVTGQELNCISDSIIIRSVNNDQNNMHYFELLYIINKTETSVIQIKNTDYSVEFEYICDYFNPNISVKVYTIYDLAKGFYMNIFFDLKNKEFYKSDWYNGSEEIMLYNTIDLSNNEFKTVRIASPDCGNNNNIKIFKLNSK